MTDLILDNIIFSLQKAGGISVVWQNLLCGLLENNVSFKCLEYEGSELNIHRKDIFIPEHIIQHQGRRNKVLASISNPYLKNESEPFVFHSSWYRICRNPQARNVLIAHDFIYENGYLPGFFSRGRIYFNHKALKLSDAIVCISENTKRDLLKHIPSIDSSKVHVIYNAASEDYCVIENHNNKDLSNYILFVGGRQSYKNFEFAVEAVAQTKFNMLICGNSLLPKEKALVESKLGHGRYIVKVRPTNKELNDYYNAVFALVYPSSYEGFGIPILEAQKAGCPAIALNASSIPEVAIDRDLLMHGLDIAEFNRLMKIYSNSNNRERIISAGLENASKFSWDKTVKKYIELYSSLIS